MTDQARDALSVALEKLRRGDEELRRASETASRLAGQAAHKPGGIKLDGPEWARIMAANEMEHHVMGAQEERKRAVGAALLEATTARRGAPWRPTSAVNDIMAYASERSATHGAIGLTPQFRLVSPREFLAAVMSTSSYPEETWRAPGFRALPDDADHPGRDDRLGADRLRQRAVHGRDDGDQHRRRDIGKASRLPRSR